jgi:hypothetical protein
MNHDINLQVYMTLWSLEASTSIVIFVSPHFVAEYFGWPFATSLASSYV